MRSFCYSAVYAMMSSMYKISIICLGKLKEKAYTQLEQEFLKRLSPFAKVKVIELPEEPYRKNDDLDKIKHIEAKKITQRIPDGAVVVLLSENGALKSSVEFSQFVDRLGSIGQEIVFVIGSGIGLHESLGAIGNYTFSLSPLTFPHNLARVLLVEQIYRAVTIATGKDYHK